jgi:hypothetical protein
LFGTLTVWFGMRDTNDEARDLEVIGRSKITLGIGSTQGVGPLLGMTPESGGIFLYRDMTNGIVSRVGDELLKPGGWSKCESPWQTLIVSHTGIECYIASVSDLRMIFHESTTQYY